MEKIKNYLKKNWVVIVLLVVMIVAIFVRVYKFDDWLYFKMDQSRDALLLSNAVEKGPGYLPLLGARVGAVKLKHGFLRVGPISYYFQYLSGVIFHSTQPYVFAYPDLLFSILAIPLLYFLALLYFSKKNALLIAAMYAFSFIIIQYSRFAWNPNSLQFFLLLSFYGLLRFLNEGDEKRKKLWLAIWAVAITIGSQLHFFGFFSLLGISGLLIAFHLQWWKKENIRASFEKEALKKFATYAGVVLIIVAIFYAPVVISDLKRNGENTHNFFEALTSKAANKPLQQKIIKTATENLKYYCLITTSDCFEGNLKRSDYPAVIVSALIFLAGLILTIRKLRQKNISTLQKDFLALIIIWIGVFTILTIPVAFQLRPRFFIVVFATPFIFLGLMYEYLEEKINRRQALVASILLTAGIIGWNSHGTYDWFKEQAKSQKSAFPVKRTLILKAKDGVTLGQLQGVADWMYARHRMGATLYYYVKPEHVRPIEYLLHEKQDKNLNFLTLKVNEDPRAQYFAVMPANDKIDSIYVKYGRDINVIASQQFGQLRVYEIDFPGRITSSTFKFKSKGSSEDRIYWKDVFGANKKQKPATTVN